MPPKKNTQKKIRDYSTDVLKSCIARVLNGELELVVAAKSINCPISTFRRWMGLLEDENSRVKTIDQLLDLKVGKRAKKVIDLEKRTLCYYDSLQSNGYFAAFRDALTIIKNWFQHQEMPVLDWVIKIETCPAQGNGYDCGVCCCLFAKHISFFGTINTPELQNMVEADPNLGIPTFRNADMILYRADMGQEILQHAQAQKKDSGL